MANISALLEIIRTAHLGRDMRQALHDSIRDVNNDTENALGKSLTFVTATRKLSLKAKDGSTLSEVVIPGGSGSGSVNSVNNVQPDADGNVTVNLADINDVNLNSPTSGQVLKYDGEKWINGSGGGGGTTDYSDLTNKPQINGVTLSGNKTSGDLNLQSALTFTSTPSENNKVVCQNDLPSGGGGSNPNLLDNAFFTINQRGFTSTTTSSVWTVDRWKTGNFSSATMQLNSNGGITLASASSSRSYVYQPIEDYDKKLNGKTITISLDVDGTIYSDTKTISDVTSSYYKIWTLDSGFQIGYILQGGDKWLYIAFNSDSSTEKSVNVRSVKVEYGTSSTLALDTEPNYTTELLKCQRYLYPLKGFSTFGKLATNTNNRYFVMVGITLPTEMRVIPTLSGTCYGYDVSNHSGALSDLTVSGKQNIIVSGIFPSGASLTTGLGEFEFRDAYLSAEL